jgi:tRNA dimethylallyltransferase
VIFILGTTASGKTALSEEILKAGRYELINIDAAQMYSKFSIGTAKPLKEELSCEHHLFDFIDQAVFYTSRDYKKLAQEKCLKIWERGKVPVFVGGTLFYAKEMLFEWQGAEPICLDSIGFNLPRYEDVFIIPYKEKRQLLQRIDSVRSDQINSNDDYRVTRALEIALNERVFPSSIKECESNFFSSVQMVFISPEREILKKRINFRLDQMFSSGWIKEAESCLKTEWEFFLRKKRFIGYSSILDWLLIGNFSQEAKEILKVQIERDTFAYAKRQVCFWKMLVKKIKKMEIQVTSCQVSSWQEGLDKVSLL